VTDHAKPEAATAESVSGVHSEHAEATQWQPVPSSQAEAVARVLDRLSNEIRQAAVMLRSTGHTPALAATPASVLCDPWSVVDLVTYDLARRGIKSQFGPEADLTTAAQAATRLLEALGLRSVAQTDERLCMTRPNNE
jgi:hypothetical protein